MIQCPVYYYLLNMFVFIKKAFSFTQNPISKTLWHSQPRFENTAEQIASRHSNKFPSDVFDVYFIVNVELFWQMTSSHTIPKGLSSIIIVAGCECDRSVSDTAFCRHFFPYEGIVRNKFDVLINFASNRELTRFLNYLDVMRFILWILVGTLLPTVPGNLFDSNWIFDDLIELNVKGDFHMSARIYGPYLGLFIRGNRRFPYN